MGVSSGVELPRLNEKLVSCSPSSSGPELPNNEDKAPPLLSPPPTPKSVKNYIIVRKTVK